MMHRPRDTIGLLADLSRFDTGVPHIARVCNYWLGGCFL
jgi:hypothetical protein